MPWPRIVDIHMFTIFAVNIVSLWSSSFYVKNYTRQYFLYFHILVWDQTGFSRTFPYSHRARLYANRRQFSLGFLHLARADHLVNTISALVHVELVSTIALISIIHRLFGFYIMSNLNSRIVNLIVAIFTPFWDQVPFSGHGILILFQCV